MIRHKIYQILIIIFALTLSACEETFVEAFGVENPSGEVVPPSDNNNSVELGSVITNAATNIGTATAKLNGIISSKGNSNNYTVGFLLYTGIVSNFTINTSGVKKYVASVSGTSFSRTLNTLTDNTTYKFRAYITNEAGTSYGTVRTFTTEEETTGGGGTTTGTNFTCLQTLAGHSNVVNSVAYSPDGSKIISGSQDGIIKIWDANTGACFQTLTGHFGSVRSVAFSHDGSKIISGAGDKTIKIWDANTGECLQTLEGHLYSVRSVAFSPDGTRIISGSSDSTIKIWGEN